jgi:hypothetical protein
LIFGRDASCRFTTMVSSDALHLRMRLCVSRVSVRGTAQPKPALAGNVGF